MHKVSARQGRKRSNDLWSSDVHTANETVLHSSNFVKMIDFVKYFHNTSKTKHNE